MLFAWFMLHLEEFKLDTGRASHRNDFEIVENERVGFLGMFQTPQVGMRSERLEESP